MKVGANQNCTKQFKNLKKYLKKISSKSYKELINILKV